MSEAERAILALLQDRGPRKTICPSEAARHLAGLDGDWRSHMPGIHDAVRKLAANGRVSLSWKGRPKDAPIGPYRIGQVR
ncbi:DUF3253 domain-containing protein [Aurantiacibacter aquimixticola]|uniref:DUF3253 domain-containing protein n=1 Tax=Aurantiacibacter aquimixticola TaxID=1958945 RepID=A0A419RW17_9SPHN|nr:DUF3253 domain-containing protein [Aurantiacibacter aquimixticola]RJY09957.1 DUF3253 domain-containing protein [Aurantiacibacter aquimixticola]